MAIELTKLAFGFLLLFFHRPIADTILQQDQLLVSLLRQRGLPLPSALSTETTRTIYFLLGTVVVLYQLGRIWMSLRG